MRVGMSQGANSQPQLLILDTVTDVEIPLYRSVIVPSTNKAV